MKLTLIAVLVTATLASAQDYPYPPDWNPNAPEETDGGAQRCASKYRGRKFTCLVTTDAAPEAPLTVEIYADRLPPEQRPGAYDLTIPPWGMTCACQPAGKGFRNHRNAFVCEADHGAFVGTRVAHSDFKGYGQGAPFGGQWRALCDDFAY